MSTAESRNRRPPQGGNLSVPPLPAGRGDECAPVSCPVSLDAFAPPPPGRRGPGGSGPQYQPLYQQVRTAILGGIENGAWSPGQMIPSEMELAQHFGVSQGTVRKAVEVLAAEHVLVRRQGKGTFVASHDEPWTKFRFLRLRADDARQAGVTSQVVECRRVRPPADVALVLGLEPDRSGTRVLYVRRQLSDAVAPVVVDDIWLAGEEFRNLTLQRLRSHRGSLYALFEAELGTRMLTATETVRAVHATAPQAALLGVAPGTALLGVERVTSTYNQRPVEFRRGLYRTDRHHYFTELR